MSPVWLSRRLAALQDPEQFALRPTKDGAVLDLGCGSKKWAGAVGLDVSSGTDADIVHDLDVFPYPIGDNTFDVVLMQDVIEHVGDLYGLMAEVHRIGRPGARVLMRTPHFSSALAFGDPTHKHFLSLLAVDGLAQPGFAHYSQVRFRVVSKHLDLWLPFRLTGIERLANRFPREYEAYFAFRFPAMNIRAEFEVLK
jgi:SAM-dependent methyltransferase